MLFDAGGIIGGILNMFGMVFLSMKPLLFLLAGMFIGFWILRKIIIIFQERAFFRIQIGLRKKEIEFLYQIFEPKRVERIRQKMVEKEEIAKAKKITGLTEAELKATKKE